ncbi:CoA pyrophosphatase [Pseudoxanthomonas suwonensis]|uniref:CoA pyrophosphatase n=1 Tax=Pseudoxanthomonas suwonensis TaxID=314722 RepID=UPI003CCE34E2
MSVPIDPPAPSSPCIGLCRLDGDGLCEGCLRSGAEIGAWSRMDEAQRRHLMEDVLRHRQLQRQAFLQRLHERSGLRRVLHPLRQPPREPGWNREELHDLLLPDHQPAEAAVLVGLVPRDEGTRVLLTLRTDGLRHHGGQVSFPGGRIEASDRGVLGAALRESHEEIALPVGQVAPLGYLDPLLTISGFRITPVVAAIDPDFNPRPEPGEVAQVFEVPLDYLMEPSRLRHIDMDYRGRTRTVLEYDWPGQRIWGATAAILYNLRRRLEEGA